ncbi:hypothetical protein, partial [Klebsiella oxytoca]|uniref:hypothetical protein n=1 Tax=Klebsiella oxytoca TaxID=571 RepID=UPI001C9E4A06
INALKNLGFDVKDNQKIAFQTFVAQKLNYAIIIDFTPNYRQATSFLTKICKLFTIIQKIPN